MSILYSTDGGQTYGLLKTTRATADYPTSGNDFFNRSFKATKNDLAISFTRIRFAFVGTNDYSKASYNLTSIVINNYVNLINKLDAEGTCSYSNTQKSFLIRQYSVLTSEEKTALQANKMTNYDQTYEQGYQYLLSYWELGGGNNLIFDLVSSNKNNSLIIIVVITSVITASLAFLLVKRKQKQ